MTFKKLLKFSSLAFISAFAFSACGGDEPAVPEVPDTPERPELPETTSNFAKGADMSWLTQMEDEGLEFFAPGSSVPTDPMKLLKDTKGMNALRLRVWVNPADKYNGIDDVMAKARRANALGLRLMIDFHFSDTWADPSHQATPEAWKNHDINALATAVASHVAEMLGALKAEGITPEWVQIGNETTQGMLWPLGSLDNPANFAQLVNAGYDAAKLLAPDVKVVIHLDKGEDSWRYTNLFAKLIDNGGKFDMIGMSLYPESPDDQNPTEWKVVTDRCVANIKTLHTVYKKPIIICETGMHYAQPQMTKEWLSYLRNATEALGYVDGIFYWEPQAPAGYNGGYFKGCFQNGSPTEALDAFKD